MAFARWIKNHARFEILILASVAYLFTFLYHAGTMEGDSANYIIGRIFYLLVLGGLYALLCASQFLPNEKTKTIALTAFLFYYAIDRLGAIPTPFYYLGITSNGYAITFGVFFLFAMMAYLAFFAMFLLMLFMPKVRLPKLLPFIFLLVWIGCSFLAMILLFVLNAQSNMNWSTYFANITGYFLLPLLFLIAYCSLYVEGEKTDTVSNPSSFEGLEE